MSAKKSISLVACIMWAVSGTAFATLTGDDIIADAVWRNAPAGSTVLLNGLSAQVGAGAEFSTAIPPLGGSEFAIDIDGDAETIDVLFNPADLALWPIDLMITLSDLDWVDAPGQIVNVTQISASTAGFLSETSFTADTITLRSTDDLNAFGASFRATFSFEATHAERVPAPGTIILLAAGLGALKLGRRVRR